MTQFGDQLYHLGGVPVGGGMLPPTGYGAKSFFVSPDVGSDSNEGTYKNPLDTVSEAYDRCEDKRGDVVYLLNDGNTSGSARETAAIVWAKDNTHLVGLCAPSVNQRSRITPPSSTTDVDAFTPMITLSGHGCIFSNFAIVQGNSEDGKASVGLTLSGNRNYLHNVSILTGQHANQGDEASEWIRVTGSENVIEKSYIGTDTVARGNNNASANVRFGSGSSDQAARNIFRDCVFPMFADDTEPVFVKTTTAFDTQRWNLMERCIFVNTGTSTLDAAISWLNTTGILLAKDCAFYGITNVTAADSAYVQLYGISGASVVDVGHFKGVDIA